MSNYRLEIKHLPKTDSRMKTKLPVLSGITIHDTGNTRAGADADMHDNYLKNHAGPRKSWHYTVDDKKVIQHLPDNIRGLHAGNKAGNDRTIGIEICVNSDGNLLSATEFTAELTADLLHKYDLDLSVVFQHNDWTGKNCPAEIRRGRPYDWDTFISRVEHYLDGHKKPEPASEPQPKPVKKLTLTEKIIKTIKEVINATKNAN